MLGLKKKEKLLECWEIWAHMHALIGFTTVGPLGVPAGILVGFGTWLFGEIVGGALDKNP